MVDQGFTLFVFHPNPAVIKLQCAVRLGQAQVVAADGGEVVVIGQVGGVDFCDQLQSGLRPSHDLGDVLFQIVALCFA